VPKQSPLKPANLPKFGVCLLFPLRGHSASTMPSRGTLLAKTFSDFWKAMLLTLFPGKNGRAVLMYNVRVSHIDGNQPAILSISHVTARRCSPLVTFGFEAPRSPVEVIPCFGEEIASQRVLAMTY